jgi:hypothetical protein
MKAVHWLFVAALLSAAAPAVAQDRQTFAFAPVWQGYSFAEDLGVSSANLVLLPVGYEVNVSRSVSFDVYAALARGAVKIGEESFTLQGLVDTRLRASVAVTPWAVVTAAVNLPTGKATHDSEEAIVASALSTELLGFREALWGTGFGVTTGVATAWQTGSTAIGLGASYRLANGFEPSADTSFKYTPGNEARLRIAIDQNIGDSKLTVGATFQNYSDDRVDGRDLFAPGNRWRGDIAFSFRTGATASWTVFAADVLRQNGDVSLQIVDLSGQELGDSTFTAGKQNLAVAGVAGALRLGSAASLRPSVEVRLLTRDSGEGEGWLAGFGADVPLRRGGVDWIPGFRISRGAVEDQADQRQSFWGGELSLTLRFTHR